MTLRPPCFYPRVTVLDLANQTETVTSVLFHDRAIHRGVSADHLPEGTLQEPISHSLVMGPALTDLYSYSGEPGFESRETLASLQKTAHAGGFGRVALLPNTHPPIDDVAALAFFRSWSPDPFLLWGSVTQRMAGEQLTDLRELADHVVGFTDGKPIGNLHLLRRAMEYLKPLHKPLLLMAQNSSLAEGVMREGFHSLKFGLAGIPVAAETAALSGLIELVRLTKTPVHIMRVSCAQSVTLLARAKEEGLPITASVSWFQLIWHTGYLKHYDSNLRVNPPLGELSDRDSLIAGIETGIIDAIAVDHSPLTYEEKMVPFEVSPPGMIGLQVVLPLLWNELVPSGKLSPGKLWQALSDAPERILHLPCTAQKTLLDTAMTWKLNAATNQSLSQNSPLWYEEIVGKASLLQ